MANEGQGVPTPPATEKSKARARGVEHLQQLYTVATGLSLAVSIKNLIDTENINAAIPIEFSVIPYFAAYIVTLLPIAHGALWHLDTAYRDADSSGPRRGSLFVDWLLLFIESCALLGLAMLIKNVKSFSLGLLALLVFDSLWALGAHLAFSAKKLSLTIEARWAIINGTASALLIGVLVFLDSQESRVPPNARVGMYRWVLVLLIALGRTIVDYAWCREAYFPE